MHAEIGDRLVVKGHRVGSPDRTGEIVSVRGTHGGPPYVVRWSDSEQEALVYPGSDAVVEHPGAERQEHT